MSAQRCECGCGEPCARRFVKGHNRRRDVVERFWAKVDKTEGCWNWTGVLLRGYGQFAYRRRMVLAHRFAYELLVGPIPDGLVIDHLCRNPRCVNPAHLEPVTPRENVLRGVGPSAVHAVKTHCIHGHPFDEANTYIRTRNGTKIRDCRACNRERQARLRDELDARRRARQGHGAA